MKTVLITGATGFIGHFLVEEFIKDHKIICLVRPKTRNLKRIAVYTDRLSIIEHDISKSLKPLVDSLGTIDIILHAGGNASAADSIADPVSVINDNVIGTINLLEFARLQKLERFVYYSSGEVFGPVPNGSDSKETDPYNSNSPYAASKAAGEELCLSYASSFGVPVSIVHINNTFGPKCQVNRLPTIIINNIINGKPVNIHSDLNGNISGRRWFYAGDVALHTKFILSNQKLNCEKWNSAGNKFINNLEFAQLIAQSMQKDLQYELILINNPNHKLCFSVNPSKLYDLGYKDKFTLEERIQQTTAWYSKNPSWLL